MLNLKNKLNKFLLFILIQIVISLAVIITFEKSFYLKPYIIPSYLIVVFGIHFFIIIWGLFLYSIDFIRFSKITKYLISFIYGCFAVILYFSYLLAFLANSTIREFYLRNIIGVPETSQWIYK